MFILIYYVLKYVVTKNFDNIQAIIIYAGTFLVMLFGISLMCNAVTGDKTSTKNFSKGFHGLIGKLINGLAKVILSAIKFVFWIGPNWTYKKINQMLENLPMFWRELISIIGFAVTVVILI